jgi:dipeptidyl aminopeptidase/acylaminoacyl peptidase
VFGTAGFLALLGVSDRAIASPVREPLPVDIATSIRVHEDRSSIAYSPDGAWIAHTVTTSDFLSPKARFYSPTGVPLAEGWSRREALLTNTRTGEEVRLGGASSSSWGPVWSPDGTRVAFYSDEGGSAGLWVWDLATRRATRFPGVIARPFFGFELPRWSADGRTILCKLLPEKMTVSQANALSPRPETKRVFPDHGPDAPGVLVFRSTKDAKAASDASAVFNRSLADLAVLYPQTGEVDRIARSAKILWYGFSPDQHYVAYTRLQAHDPNGQDILYDIVLVDRRSGHTTLLAPAVSMNWGTELNWSPDGRSLAVISRDSQNAVSLSVIPTDKSPARRLIQTPIPAMDEVAPHWTQDGRSLLVTTTDSNLWRIDALTGTAQRITAPPGVGIRSLVAKPDQATAWTADHQRHWWVIGLREHQYSILRVDAGTDRAEVLALPAGEVEPLSLDANDATGKIAWAAGDQHHLADFWAYDIERHRIRQVSRLNPDVDRYALGDARLISFRSADGKDLRASLLLPPGYRPGTRLPTVVWVYGGENGSDAVNTFGLIGDTPLFNMHILATRGYAVLFPDTPLSKGNPVKDLLGTVMPAVDAAIAQGYSDPTQLAVMGNSFGAYAVLALISHTNRFKAAVVSASVINPDLMASYLEMEPDGSPRWIGYFERGQMNLGGSPWEYRERYLENALIYDFDKITTPLLMAQGGEDGRLLGSDATFLALRRLGKDVEYRIYDGEDHVLQRKVDIRDFWLRRLDFLQSHLSAHSPPPANGRPVQSGN